ncbi:MAG: chromosome segregation ATPase, partial [Alteraurantiacibacter sp. bin_em_oilr2.035]|nr:chromosome segregation ATPase [Alteraurantiacibacter sp. bin_em_oilr2.035]
MYDSFTHQLAGLDLAGLAIKPAPFDPSDFPSEEAAEQTLAAIWSDMFVMFSGTSLEADAEDVAWGFVNLFHRAASRKSTQLDRATDEVRALLAAADGSEVHSSNLEEQVERAQAAEASMIAFEQMREIAASLYLDETGSSWKPFTGSRSNHSRKVTSAVVDARDFLRARAERRQDAHSPEGTPVIFAGGRVSFNTMEEARSYADNIWATL